MALAKSVLIPAYLVWQEYHKALDEWQAAQAAAAGVVLPQPVPPATRHELSPRMAIEAIQELVDPGCQLSWMDLKGDMLNGELLFKGWRTLPNAIRYGVQERRDEEGMIILSHIAVFRKHLYRVFVDRVEMHLEEAVEIQPLGRYEEGNVPQPGL